MPGHLKGKATYGSCKTRSMKATKQVAELVEAGEDAPLVPDVLPRASKRAVTPISKLSDEMLENIVDSWAMGKSLLKIAQETKVDVKELSLFIKKRIGVYGKRKYEQVREITLFQLNRMMQTCDKKINSTPIEDLTPKWIDAKLRVLRTVADVYGIMNKSPVEESVRVAGLSQQEVDAEIMKRL